MRPDHALLAALAFALVESTTGCLELSIPAGAVIVCASDEDCFKGHVCVVEQKRCAEPDRPCTEFGSSRALPDGTPCGEDRVCLSGLCSEPSRCGDGRVDVDAGEECEAGGAVPCRDDCLLPVCGDGTQDPGEGCDVDLSSCSACVQICDLFTADCNVDVSDGCECTPTALATVPDPIVVVDAVFVGDDAWIVGFDPDVDDADVVQHVDLLTGDVSTLGAFQRADSVHRVDSDVYVVTSSDGDNMTVSRINGAQITPVATNDLLGSATVDDERIWFAGFSFDAFDRDTGAYLDSVGDALDCRNDLVSCGGWLACSNIGAFGGGWLTLAAKDGSEQLEVLETADGTLEYGCNDDTLVYASDTQLGTIDASGAVHPQLPIAVAGAGAVFEDRTLIVFRDGASVVSRNIGSFSQAFLVGDTGGLRSLGAGTAYDAAGSRVLILDVSDLYVIE